MVSNETKLWQQRGEKGTGGKPNSRQLSKAARAGGRLSGHVKTSGKASVSSLWVCQRKARE